MTTVAQRRAVKRYRERSVEQGMTRVEVKVPRANADLIRSVAALLRSQPGAAERLTQIIDEVPPSGQTWGEYLKQAPDLSGPEFDQAFDLPRDRWPLREVDL